MGHPDDPAGARATPEDEATNLRGERRLPVIAAVVVAMVLPFLMPSSFTLGPQWLFPVLEGILLVAMAASDPGRIDHRSRRVRGLRIALIVLLVAGASFAAARLSIDLVRGSPDTDSAGPLLRAGGLVWLYLVLAFAFLFWELDGGGPGTRAHVATRHPDLAFPQHLAPELAPPGWRPVFADYLYLGWTNAIAFSPTDVMPLAHWAKLTMALQSMASLVILGLVIARAVNIIG